MSRLFSLSLALCISFLFLGTRVEAFNITAILSQYSDFSSFNNYLTETQIAAAVNGRQTITILAVANGNLGAIDGQPADFVKKILSIHVILDYYDVQKLEKMPNKSTLLTTLYQTTGMARNQEGFVNCTISANQDIVFGSGVPGSGLNSNLVKSVTSQPYNISVLQVGSLIVPPGGGSSGGSNSSSGNSTTHSPPPAASAPKSAPPPSNSSKAPAPSKATPPPSGGKAPAGTPPDASSPSSDIAPTADTPAADSPKASPPRHASSAPAADGPAADAPADDDSGASGKDGIRISLLVMVLSFTLIKALAWI